MSNIIVCNDSKRAIILAALRHYQATHHNRDKTNPGDIASCGGEVTTLDEHSIESLCQEFSRGCPPKEALSEALLKHLTFGDVVELFGVNSSDDRYAKAACEKTSDGEFQVDDVTVVSCGDDPGAYVMCWVWVTNEEAGIKPATELLLTAILVSQRYIKEKPLVSNGNQARRHSAIMSWLDALTNQYSEQLDYQEYEDIDMSVPVWTNTQAEVVHEQPSVALDYVLNLVVSAGFPDREIEQAECLFEDLGKALDAVCLAATHGG